MLNKLIENLTLEQYCNSIEFANNKEYEDDPVQLFTKVFNLTVQQEAELYATPLIEINEYEQKFIDVILTSTSDIPKKVKIYNKTYKVPQTYEKGLTFDQFIQLDFLIKEFWESNKIDFASVDNIEYVNRKFIEYNYKIMPEALAIVLNCDLDIAKNCNAKDATKICNFFLLITLNLKIKKVKLNPLRTVLLN